MPVEEQDVGFADFGSPASGSQRRYPAPVREAPSDAESAAEATPRRRFRNLEHETGLEPATPTLAGESEPPNLPTEKNAGCCAFEVPKPRSPVRMREGPTAKTPRNRGNFSCCFEVRAGSLRSGRLGGGESGIRTLSTVWRMGSESEP